MERTYFDDLHAHATWGPALRPESVGGGSLHRHRIADPGSMPRFTTWEHNGPNHSHRLPAGAWTRPRVDLRPARDEATVLGRKDAAQNDTSRPHPIPA